VLPGQGGARRRAFQDVLDEKILRQKVEAALDTKNNPGQGLQPQGAGPGAGRDEVLAQSERIADRIADTRLLLNQALAAGGDDPAGGFAGHDAGRRPRHGIRS